MTVRVYRWDDASAPSLTNAAGSLTSLLHAVLVAGYGSKTPAGWTRDWNGTNEAGFTAFGGNLGIRVSHTASSNTASIVGYESINGSGVTSGQFPTAAQIAVWGGAGLSWYLTATTDGTARPWLIAADNQRFYLWIGHSVSTATGLATTVNAQTYFAGYISPNKGDDLYHFTVVGGEGTSSTLGPFCQLATSMATALNGHYVARGYNQLGTSLKCGKICDLTVTSGFGTGTIAYPDPVSLGMLLAPVRATEPTNLRGHYPGIWNPQHNLPGNPGDTFTGTGALIGKTFLLLDSMASGSRSRIALEISDTWS